MRKLWISGSSCGGLHDIQAGHEELGILTGGRDLKKKDKKREDESIDRFLDDLESLRRKSEPEESTNRRNFSVASKFIDGVRSD